MIARRGFLLGMGASAVASASLGGLASPALARVAGFGLNAQSEGLRAGAEGNQGAKLQAILEKASKSNLPVFLPPGKYRVSNVVMPENTRLFGIKGATHLEYAGGNHFLWAENARHVELSGLMIDGGFMTSQDYAGGALRVLGAKTAIIEDCHITKSAISGIQIDRSQGRISNNKIDSANGDAGIFGVENNGLLIEGNLIEECGNAGILVHRYERGEDNTIVTNNRVRRITAVNGGTGQFGNGINTANADGVIVSNNHVSDCTFSTIRSFSCSNIQITNNTCLRAGETSVYSEFSFQGALIAGNIVDGAGVCGISIANLNEGGRLTVCANNLVRNVSDHRPYEDNQHARGMGIAAEADISLSGNVIEDTKNYGMSLGWGEYMRNITANGNMIRKTRTGFAVSMVEGTGKVGITNNVLSNISNGGIVGYRWLDPVTGDLARTGAGNNKNLTIANNSLNY